MMNKTRLALPTFLLAASLSTTAQTLVTYGSGSFDKNEFLRAYNKNKPATTDREQSMRDYLTLYTNFKLKVKAAQEEHIDTLAQIKYDTQNFREQIAKNYLDDQHGMQALVDEAIARSGVDRHIVYFFIPVAENATAADTVAAAVAAKNISDAVGRGEAGYPELAAKYSGSSKVNFTDAGYVTAFTLPYDMENIVYRTAIGSAAAPYRTHKGWVIFKVLSERPDPGKVKAAQILFAYPPNADYETKLAVKQKADSVYGLLQNGLSFDEAAKTFSDDRLTYMAGGELPAFSTGRYGGAFEDHVFALTHEGEITRPFETEYGYHIEKLISRTPYALHDASYAFDMRQKVQADARVKTEKEEFVKQITTATGNRRVPGVSDADLLRFADSSFAKGDNPVTDFPIAKKAILRFKDGTTLTGADWLAYAKEQHNKSSEKLSVPATLHDFEQQSILNYYRDHLEAYNEDFKFQMQEFREGNMLFEIMERNVWSKAGLDSAGLKAYYDAHAANYKWANSADVWIFSCADNTAAQQAIRELQAGKNWQEIAQGSNNRVQADSGRYEIAQLPGTGLNDARDGSISQLVHNPDSTVTFVRFVHVYAPDMPRNFPDARGLVINDYQSLLEEKWIAELRKKYPVKINEAVFQQAVRESK